MKKKQVKSTLVAIQIEKISYVPTLANKLDFVLTCLCVITAPK